MIYPDLKSDIRDVMCEDEEVKQVMMMKIRFA